MTPTLPERIKEAVSAAEQHKSVSEISEACSVSVQTVYAWRRGETINLKGETLVELAEVSGLNARWIISGKGKKTGPTKEERLILEALPLISDDMRESWMDAARRAIERVRAKQTAS